MKSPRKNSLTPPPHKYYIQNMLWVMDRDFYFSTADIHTAMDVMKEAQTGIALGMEAWVKGEFHLTEEQLSQLKEQVEKFAEFVGK